MDIEQEIRTYLPDIVHMSLGTSKDNKPWVCEVHFAYDDQLNFYFRSLLARRHSQEILLNPAVAGNIVTQHALGEKVRAVYFDGTAVQLTNSQDKDTAYILFKERLGLNNSIRQEADQDDGHQFFKITISTFYLFDARASSPAQKFELTWNASA